MSGKQNSEQEPRRCFWFMHDWLPAKRVIKVDRVRGPFDDRSETERTYHTYIQKCALCGAEQYAQYGW